MSNLTLTTTALTPEMGRWMIGVDQLVGQLLNAPSSSRVSYPPYNIICRDDDHYSIEIAVAGFGEQDLEVTVNNGMLIVTGDIQEQPDEDVKYVHRALSRRKFQREWRLVEYMEVVGATVKNGIMTIELERKLPEALKPRSVAINFAR